MSPSDPVWDELGKIDYLLEQLSRAVDRGQIDRAAWDTITPCYYERRAELAAILTNRAKRLEVSGAPAAAAVPGLESRPFASEPEPGAQPAASTVAVSETPEPAATVVSAAVPAAAAGAPSRIQPQPQAQPAWSLPQSPGSVPHEPVRVPAPAREQLSAGTLMSYAGALLVVIAVAIFSVYAWATFPPMLKMGVLLAVTAAFYVGGEVVRIRMELPAVGVALVSVGSAMLLFDGWSIIRALGASGPWPWAVVLLVCSLAYWATELRIAGGWFGAIGAAAQVGWWWMLGSALGWRPDWVAAGTACVAVAWAFASTRGTGGPFATLRTVLRVGSIIVASASAVAVAAASVAAQSGHGPTFTPIAAAAVTALAFTAVVERLEPKPRGQSVVGHAPLFIAMAAYWLAATPSPAGGAVWPLALAAAVMTVLYAVYAPVRGSAPYALAALAAEGGFWFFLSQYFQWSNQVTLAVLLGFGFSAFLAGALLGRLGLSPESWPGAAATARAWEWGGVALLAATSLLVLAVFGAPLSGVPIARGTAWLSLGVLAAWIAASLLRRSAGLGRVALAWSFHSLAAVLASGDGGWHSAWYGSALLGLAVVYAQMRTLVTKVLRVPENELGSWCRGLYLAITVLTVAGSAWFFRVDAFPVAAFLGLAGVAWMADGLRTRDWWTLAPGAASMTAAAGVAAWAGWGDLGFADASWVCATVALAIAMASVFSPRRSDSWGASAAAGAVVTATALAASAYGGGWRLAVALLVVAAAWAVTAVPSAITELVGVGAALGTLSLLTALSIWKLSGSVTVIALALSAGILLAPRAFVRSAPGSSALRMTRSLASAGAGALAELTAIGLISYLSLVPFGLPEWMRLGATGAALGFALAGAYALAWTSVEGVESGLYFGLGLIVIGAMIQMDGSGLRDAEWYFVLAGLYFGGMGVLWASRAPGRRIPSSTDLAAFILAVAAPLWLAFVAFTPEAGLRHGLITLALAVASTAVGLVGRTRIYFQGGIAVLVLDALWLSRSVLMALPSWVWIGGIGLALLAGGIVYARREGFEGVGQRIREGFSSWR